MLFGAGTTEWGAEVGKWSLSRVKLFSTSYAKLFKVSKKFLSRVESRRKVSEKRKIFQSREYVRFSRAGGFIESHTFSGLLVVRPPLHAKNHSVNVSFIEFLRLLCLLAATLQRGFQWDFRSCGFQMWYGSKSKYWCRNFISIIRQSIVLL